MTEQDILDALHGARLAAYVEERDGDIITICVADAYHYGKIRLIPEQFPDWNVQSWASEVAAWVGR
jgi:hypothetical protein